MPVTEGPGPRLGPGGGRQAAGLLCPVLCPAVGFVGWRHGAVPAGHCHWRALSDPEPGLRAEPEGAVGTEWAQGVPSTTDV